jgi:hypothetical protein
MSKYKSLTMAAAICTLGAAADTDAAQVVFQPRLSVGMQDYELTFTDVLTPAGNGFDFRDGFTIKDRIAFSGAGLTVSSGRFFADLSMQRSRAGEAAGEIFQSSATGFGTTNSLGHNHLFDSRFEREELSATAGWGVTGNLSLYLGYKKATLDMTQARTPALSPVVFGDVLQLGTTSWISHIGVFSWARATRCRFPAGAHSRYSPPSRD